jgi:hypothetical protein
LNVFLKNEIRKANFLRISVGALMLAGMFFGLAALAPRKISASGKRVVNCSAETIFNYLKFADNLQQLRFWPDWENMEQPITTGTNGMAGYMITYAEDGKPYGSFMVRRLIEYSFIECQLIYYSRPDKVWTTYISLNERSENSTEVTWGFWANIPYPLNLKLLFSNPSAKYRRLILASSLEVLGERLEDCP